MAIVGCNSEGLTSSEKSFLSESSSNSEKEEFFYDQQYSFARMDFYCREDLTLEDIKAELQLQPALISKIDSIEALQEYIIEHIDKFIIVKRNENGMEERIYFTNSIDAITFLENNQVVIVWEGETQTIPCQKDGEKFVLTDRFVFSYENGYVYYSSQIVDGFGIKYIFENE